VKSLILFYFMGIYHFMADIKVHRMHLQKKWLTKIREGRKIYEGRLKEKTKNMKIGDIIIFEMNKNEFTEETYVEPVKTEITELEQYHSFCEMLESKKLENVLPDVKTIGDGVDIYYKIPEYQKKEIDGVTAIGIKVIKN
jgi:ASC-1-like (ASCH) protein